MEKEQISPPLSPQEKEYRLGESREQKNQEERIREEVDALFDHQWHPETLRHLAPKFSETHKRFAILIESGKATKEDEKAFIEGSCGWRKGPFPLEKWREKLAWAPIPPQERGQ